MQPGGGVAIAQSEPFEPNQGSDFTPRGATVMIGVRAEKLFQIIIGPGQIRHRRAGEESWPVTPGDLPEVPQRWCEGPSRSLMSPHRPQESLEPPLHRQRLGGVLC